MIMQKKFPIPVCGLALGFAALGNLFPPYYWVFRCACGIISFAVIMGFTIRAAVDFTSVKKEMENPVAFSVLPTYTMTLMLLSAYVIPFARTAAVTVWILALALQFVMMAFFIKAFVLKFNIKQVFPSWFIMFVGIVAASVTSPAIGMKTVGQVIFYAGFTLYLVLLPLILYRVLKVGGIPDQARTTIAIFCAPAGLCATGYMRTFDYTGAPFATFLFALSLLSWLGVLAAMFKLLRLPFSPGYSAFTFPLVISATAFSAYGMYIGRAELYIVSLLRSSSFLIATSVTLYVLGRYCILWFSPSPAEARVSQKS